MLTNLLDKFKLKTTGFTLAEVLITLGIIGVVAALTLPTLIASYQKQVYVNKLKKMVSTLENGLRQAAADEGVDVDKTELFLLINAYSSISDYSARFNAINKYFKIIGKNQNTRKISSKTNRYDTWSYGLINFTDGGAINYSAIDESLDIDTNGVSGPNEYGKDFFKVLPDESGILHDYDDCNRGRIAKGCGLCKNKLKNNPNYDGCYLYRIQSDGWQMKY